MLDTHRATHTAALAPDRIELVSCSCVRVSIAHASLPAKLPFACDGLSFQPSNASNLASPLRRQGRNPLSGTRFAQLTH